MSQHQSRADYPSNERWKENIKDYEYQKKHLMWGQNPKPRIITNKLVKEKENIFNPISQMYYDNHYNQALRAQENSKIKNSIANNYDSILRNEQTYDIINLKDKLKGFENHKDYPLPKSEARTVKNLETSREKHNIISNISLDKHNFLPPEIRPPPEEDINTIPHQKINAVIYKDYDIISNRYKLNHEEKEKTNQQIEELNAAQKYWKFRDYDHIKGAFYDPKKEKEFQMQRSENEKNWGKNRKYKRKEE